ncbi:MAG: HAMP domain-containing protein [Bryobacteraceae bacterium]|nr:HAMP domain-containing protein [Bryobacteraceae bacterium]
MRIRAKLTLALLAPALAGVLISGWLGYRAARASLTERVALQLTSVRQEKRYELESYFQGVVERALNASEAALFAGAMREFRDAVRELDGPRPPEDLREKVERYYRERYLPRLSRLMTPRSKPEEYLPEGRAPYVLQSRFIVDNPHPQGEKQELADPKDGSGYSRVHARYHPLYRRMLQRFGYDDLYLIDHETGRIVYSVKKEPDFGTSLRVGPYRNTKLAGAFEQCRDATDPEAAYVVDFEPYEPSLGAPAGFVCSAIIEEGRCTGVLAFRLPAREINRILSGDRAWERDGLGRSGESRVVGPDYLMRSDARKFIEDRDGYLDALRGRNYPEESLEKIRSYGTTVLQQEIRLPSTEAALRGEEGALFTEGPYGNSTLVAYAPLRIPGLQWAIETQMEESEVFAPVEELEARMLGLTLLVCIATAGAAFLISRSMVKPVEKLSAGALKIAAGDTAERIVVRTNDEIAMLASAFNLMADAIEYQNRQIRAKNKENEALLLNILPGPIADRLKGGENVIADNFADVTVLFADIVGFTTLSDGMSPKVMLDLLNGLFRRFDAIAQAHGVEKIKTIGDAYMAVAGLPKQYPDHVSRMADIALELMAETKRHGARLGLDLSLRIGLNTGPVVAGVIGATKFIYDLWGDTVNVASRMESHGLPDAIQVTREVFEKLDGDYEFAYRGPIDVKGKGLLETWLLVGRKTPQGVSSTAA